MTTVAARTSRNRIVADGQSLNLTPLAAPWPSLITADFADVPINNKSVLGTPWDDLLKRAPQEVFPLLTSAANTVLVLGIGGESDLNGENDAGAEIYADLVAYVTAAKAVAPSIKVLGLTIPPSTVFSSPQNTARLDANTAILADASHIFNATVDVTVAPLDDSTGSAFAIDHLHLSAIGAQAVRALVSPTLRGMMV